MTEHRLQGSALNAARRERELAEATDGRVVDLLVVGLGITGTGVALDAASRGLDVVAVDAHDLAFGTSRWSSKLVHGGLRYLAHGRVGIAYESAYERGVLMSRTAPHLVRAMPMLIPLLPHVSPTQAAVATAGIRMGDALRIAGRTSRQVLPSPRRLTRPETVQLAPSVRRQGLRGGLLSWDGQLEDDARLVVAVARTAAAHGARVLTRCRVIELHGDGAVVRDELTGRLTSVRARAVVNATGVWADTLVPGLHLRPSRGTHLVLRASTLGDPTTAISTPVPGETSRFVFALPQRASTPHQHVAQAPRGAGGWLDEPHDGLVYVGLTDEPLDGPLPDVPQPTAADVDFLLDVISSVLASRLTPADVVGGYAGLRPLVEADGRTADLSRKHVVVTSPQGVVSVFGGKLTTYRRMAQDAVDTAVRLRDLAAGPCRTTQLPLVGAAPSADLAAVDAPGRLVERYGTEAPDVARDPALLRPLAAGSATTLAELVWGVTHEGALDVGDLLDRRTRVGLVPSDRAAAEAAAHEALAALPG
ncbi:MAG TPA: glycerol-3-phosphate dehydrogenase/oxidase [Actinomycetales bacterium]|nr:glycerol-3-phosphate dehydrogenase/oxidase [Actinomycetales bacterium]